MNDWYMVIGGDVSRMEDEIPAVIRGAEVLIPRATVKTRSRRKRGAPIRETFRYPFFMYAFTRWESVRSEWKKIYQAGSCWFVLGERDDDSPFLVSPREVNSAIGRYTPSLFTGKRVVVNTAIGDLPVSGVDGKVKVNLFGREFAVRVEADRFITV